jgi:hypothetical protein
MSIFSFFAMKFLDPPPRTMLYHEEKEEMDQVTLYLHISLTAVSVALRYIVVGARQEEVYGADNAFN